MGFVFPKKLIRKVCESVKDGAKCGKVFWTHSRMGKYCPECQKGKPWFGPHIKLLK